MRIHQWLYVTWLSILLLLTYSGNAVASNVSYTYHIKGDLIGQAKTVLSRFDDTIYSVALKHRLGAEALASANPDIDPWLPGEGIALQLPTRHILPTGHLQGIVINLPEMRLYYFAPNTDTVQVYPVGIGRQGWDTPLMSSRISSIVKNPSWTPPESIRNEFKAAGLQLAAVVPAGPDNPLGEFALRIGQSSYLIHGTNNPRGVGMRVSHGCIRLYPEHIAELAASIRVNTPVNIINQPIKLGRDNGRILIQGHQPVAGELYDQAAALQTFMTHAEATLTSAELARVKRFISQSLARGDLYNGVPTPVPELNAL